MCNKSNIELTDQDWKLIETKCKESKHIQQDENLTDIIVQDEKIIDKLNISFEQIQDFFPLNFHISVCN